MKKSQYIQCCFFNCREVDEFNEMIENIAPFSMLDMRSRRILQIYFSLLILFFAHLEYIKMFTQINYPFMATKFHFIIHEVYLLNKRIIVTNITYCKQSYN